MVAIGISFPLLPNSSISFLFILKILLPILLFEALSNKHKLPIPLRELVYLKLLSILSRRLLKLSILLIDFTFSLFIAFSISLVKDVS